MTYVGEYAELDVTKTGIFAGENNEGNVCKVSKEGEVKGKDYYDYYTWFPIQISQEYKIGRRHLKGTNNFPYR